jgi:hypothetical protein
MVRRELVAAVGVIRRSGADVGTGGGHVGPITRIRLSFGCRPGAGVDGTEGSVFVTAT